MRAREAGPKSRVVPGAAENLHQFVSRHAKMLEGTKGSSRIDHRVCEDGDKPAFVDAQVKRLTRTDAELIAQRLWNGDLAGLGNAHLHPDTVTHSRR